MKRLVYLIIALLALIMCACEQDDPGYWEPRNEHFGNRDRQNGGDNNPAPRDSNSVMVPGTSNTFTITKLYNVVMRREIPYPFQAYVLQINTGKYFYMLRYRFNQDLHIGDVISFSVFSYCQDEIAVINGCDLRGENSSASANDVDAGEYLVASDPIEATVKSMFDMNIRYSLTFWPFATRFIETTDGNLIFIKKSKLNVDLQPGDRIVYNVYTLFPNEVLALKKL